MSLPLQAVERLFDRLTATYGRQFIQLYDGLEMPVVKAAWSHELSGFAHNLQAVAWALENLPERAPNAVAFRHLCRQAPAPEQPKLPEPPANPQRLKAELAKLGEILKDRPATTTGRDWAHRIIGNAKDGAKVAPATLRMARQAVGLER